MSITNILDDALQAERRTFLEPRMEADARADADMVSVDLSSRRTGMSFQRTRMSADRTLMSVIRTSLSLITFGFTIYQFFERLVDSNLIRNANSGRNFGLALVVLGVGMLVLGISYHLHFMHGLRNLREEMSEEGLIHGQSGFPVSLTLIIAVLLLLLGLLAIASMVFKIGPFN
jgi:putative membrane protein